MTYTSNPNLMKNLIKHFMSFAVIFAAIMMAFGIGLTSVNAATPAKPAASTSELQPATGADEFRTEDGSYATEDGESTVAAKGEEHAEDSGIVGMFGLNWKLFLAQLINFGIILFVLWKWVFGPVTKGLSDRTQKIENSLQEAEKISKDRQDFDSWKQGEISTVRTEASAIIAQAKQHAEELKSETVKATMDEQNRLIEQTKERMAQEKTMMIDSAKSELADIVVQATATILKAKIDPVKDKQLIADALQQAQNGQGK